MVVSRGLCVVTNPRGIYKSKDFYPQIVRVVLYFTIDAVASTKFNGASQYPTMSFHADSSKAQGTKLLEKEYIASLEKKAALIEPPDYRIRCYSELRYESKSSRQALGTSIGYHDRMSPQPKLLSSTFSDRFTHLSCVNERMALKAKRIGYKSLEYRIECFIADKASATTPRVQQRAHTSWMPSTQALHTKFCS